MWRNGLGAGHYSSSGQGPSPGRGSLLCSWERHFTLIVPLSTQVYKFDAGVALKWTIPTLGKVGIQ